ncbi:MAG: BatA domain-containing protein [Fidelibacterota bacterium]|nr:MAG: BatA domain-containing protein [Candidatus Neomarinimicrobiota bacterium]
MSFLIPQALWALPAVAIPLIIHLISRSTTRMVDFSTLRLLNMMEHESIRRLRWHQWLVILLRTLLLLVLVLLLARPVVKGYFQGWIGDNASILSVVIIDNSFSMSGEVSQRGGQMSGDSWRSKAELESLFEILADQSSRGRVVILRATDGRMIYDGPVADLPHIDEIAGLCKPGYHQDNLTAVLDTLSTSSFQSVASLYANREVYLVSDFQAHQQRVLQHFGSDTTTWDKWQFFLIPVPDLGNNVAVVQGKIETTIPLVGELMDVAVTLQNTGHQSQRKIPVQVVLNEVRSGQLVVNLRPGERKTVQFRVAPTEPGHQQGYGEIGRDGRNEDNRFYFHTYIPSLVRVLLIEVPDSEPSFPRLALQSLASERSHIQVRVMSPSELAWTPHDVEVVILNHLETVPRLLIRQIREFMADGGTLIIIPSTEVEGAPAYSILGDEFGLPASDSEPLAFESPLSLDREALKTSILRTVFQREIDLDEPPRISRIYQVYPRGTDEVVLWTDNQKPLLTRASYSNGTIFFFSLPLHLQWTDLPLKGSFIPMWHRLIYWRPASSELTDVRIGNSPVLPLSPQQATQPMTLTAPHGVSRLIIPDLRTRTITLTDLDKPGIYSLSVQRQYQKESTTGPAEAMQFRVNVSGQELTGRFLSRSALKVLFRPDQAFILDETGAVGEWIQQARFGRELWRPFLYLLIILLILEMIFGNVYHTPRQPVQQQRS